MGLGSEEEWYESWDALFPGTARPLSPYQNHPSNWIETDAQAFAKDLRYLFEFFIKHVPVADVTPADLPLLFSEASVLAAQVRRNYLLDINDQGMLTHEQRYTSLGAMEAVESTKLCELLLRHLDVSSSSGSSEFNVLRNNDSLRYIFRAILLQNGLPESHYQETRHFLRRRHDPTVMDTNFMDTNLILPSMSEAGRATFAYSTAAGSTDYAKTLHDSGYESSFKPSQKEHSTLPCIAEDRQKDSRTFSIGRTVKALNPDMYFATELCDRVLESFRKDQLRGALTSLPSLLWEFSYKIGYESPAQYNRDIMKFVNSLYCDIAKRIEAILSDDADGDDDVDDLAHSSRHENDLDANEKMELWLALDGRSHEHDDGSTREDLKMQDSEDDSPLIHPEDREPALIGVFRSTLSQSSAYEWLLSSITSDIRFGVPGQNIRKEIHDNLIELAGRSCRSSLQQIDAVFVIFWDYPAFYRSQEFPGPMRDTLLHAITITGDSEGNQVQAMSCLEYMGALPNKTKAAAHFESGCLTVHAHGDPFSVAELGTQLAWLGAALRALPPTSDLGLPFSCAPTARYEVLQDADTDASKIRCLIRYRIDIIDTSIPTDGTATPGSCWRPVFGNISIVNGFPIPRRERPNSGMEASIGIMARLINAQRMVKFCGMTFIKGFSAMLIAVESDANTVYWHLFYNKDGDHISYSDSRVPLRFKDPVASDINIDSPETQHILGWCDDVKNYTGAREANYSIEPSTLPPPGSSFVLDRVTITAGKFVTAGASLAFGAKQKNLHSQFGDNYISMLRAIRKRYFLIYDCQDQRAWLVDGASALLHLLRAFIKDLQSDPVLSDEPCFNNEGFKEPQQPHTGSDAAIEVLKKNRALGLYEGATTPWKEKTLKTGSDEVEVVVTKLKVDMFTLENAAMEIWHRLEQIIGHYDDLSRRDGFGFQVKLAHGRRLQGFDFRDVATGEASFGPKEADLHATGDGWVDLTRAIDAITLFGSGFGDLFKPTGLATCRNCLFNSPVPKGKDYLAAPVTEIEKILKAGSRDTVPWRLAGNIHWHTPDMTFETCKCPDTQPCKAQHDRVQVLLATDNPKLWGRNFKSPGNLPSKGMVVFGHRRKFPRGLNAKGDFEEDEPEDSAEDRESGSAFQDSGIEMSKSPSVQSQAAPPSTGLYSLENSKSLDLSNRANPSNPQHLLLPQLHHNISSRLSSPGPGDLRARYRQLSPSVSGKKPVLLPDPEVDVDDRQELGEGVIEALRAPKRERYSDDTLEPHVQGQFKRHKGKGKEDGEFE
ncbi:hypothetical protein QBC44DRAFT_371552 [Cladorrhinum sp. PSN332]|nr:hypothetical protein QBC44DRAFT_371552 [Cladorrhinum sp. PSN332]